jgi:ComF family protein
LFCGKISGTQVCERCRKDFRVKNVFVAVYYREGAAKNLVINLKFGAKKELTTVMGDLMMRVIDKSKVKDYVLVPVPLDKSRGNERGFNQSELLAKEVARGLGLSVINVLGKKKRLPQMNLGKKERSQNLKDAFYTAKPVPKKVLLVDDVLTTGATVRECVRVLKENGAREVSIAVFARD